MTEIGIETWLVIAYGLGLLIIAYGIDLLARRAHTAHDEQKTKGFVYHDSHDAWLCPEDQWLWPQSFDPDNRVMRYRGNPLVCNACPVKDSCTTSADGREVGRVVDPWPSSESARFHRGIACTVTVLAAMWPLFSAFFAESGSARLVLLGTVAVIALGAMPLWSHLRRSPVAPEGVLSQSLDDNIEDRAQAAENLMRRRTSYASDRRPAADEPTPLVLGRTRYASSHPGADADA